MKGRLVALMARAPWPWRWCFPTRLPASFRQRMIARILTEAQSIGEAIGDPL
jgi:hypothetical protein